jgi:hypothetical protein
VKRELDLSDSGQNPVAGFCEDGNEFSDSIKAANFLVICDTIIFSRMTLLSRVIYNKNMSIVVKKSVTCIARKK